LLLKSGKNEKNHCSPQQKKEKETQISNGSNLEKKKPPFDIASRIKGRRDHLAKNREKISKKQKSTLFLWKLFCHSFFSSMEKKKNNLL